MTELICVTSDTHCGSVVGLMGPEPFPLDDGGEYVPSDAQRWIWGAWADLWSEAARVRDRENAKLTWLMNGDAVEGDHHNTPQIVSRLAGTHGSIFLKCAEVPLALAPDRIIAVRGTEAHGGASNQTEEGFFRAIRDKGGKVIPDSETGNATWWQFRGMVGGLLIDAAHHGRMGQRAHTREGYLRHYAHDIWTEHVMDGHEPPDLCIRSHFHTPGDSGRTIRRGTRVIATPSFQLKTAYVHKKHADSIQPVGGVLILIRDGDVDVRFVMRTPERTVWQEAV